MSLMLKLLATTLALVSLLQASSKEAVGNYIENTLGDNPNIKNVEVHITKEVKLKKPKGWSGYIVDINAVLVKGGNSVNQKSIWFSNGKIITPELLNIKTGESLKGFVKPNFEDKYYKDANLIYGNKNAKYKVVIFSDPLCPFCRSFVPSAINFMKSKPKKFALYYFHMPLPSIHPASIDLSKAAIALELKGNRKNTVLDLYKVKINAEERDTVKILKAFNKTMKSNITPADLQSTKVLKLFSEGLQRADSLMVRGTPTVFFNGKIDKSKNKYKTAK